MDNAELYGAFREYALDSIREAFQTVNATNQNVSHATVLKVCKDSSQKLVPLTLRHIQA